MNTNCSSRPILEKKRRKSQFNWSNRENKAQGSSELYPLEIAAGAEELELELDSENDLPREAKVEEADFIKSLKIFAFIWPLLGGRVWWRLWRRWRRWCSGVDLEGKSSIFLEMGGD